MKRFSLFLAGLVVLLFTGTATAQMAGQLCTTAFASRANCGAQTGVNMLMNITDSTTVAIGATVAGGGANSVTAFCQATACTVAADDAVVSGGSALTGTTADTWTVDSDGGGTEAIVTQGGATPLQLGDATTTAINGMSDSDFNLINTSSNSVALHLRDYGDTTDDDMAHVSITGNCTTTTTGAEDCDAQINTVEAGAVSSARLLIDGDGDNVFAPERPSGGNGNGLTTNNQRRINGIPKIAPYSIATGKVNTNTINTDFGDSETPDTDWTQTANITSSDENTIIRMGTGSLELLVGATPADTNGADNALGSGNQDWTDDESFGLWHRCDTVYNAGDWYLGITDNASEDVTTTFPAYGTANTWVWTELEIGSVANGDKDVITDISLSLSSAGATTFTGGGTCYFDFMWKWDAAEENALGLDIYEDGLLSVMSMITATGGDRTPIIEVEGTDYFVHYETGVDFFVSITDLSNDSLFGMAALE